MPLSTKGISHQIISSLITFKVENLGTINDCKIVINHLIRKFSEPLEKEGLQKKYISKLVIDQSKAIKEHLFPVNEIMNHLLAMPLTENKDVLANTVHAYLENALILVYVTKDEDNQLNKFGFQRNMPIEYSDPKSPLYSDVWARYKCSNLFSNIIE